MAVKKVNSKAEETKKDVAVEVETPAVDVETPEVEVETPAETEAEAPNEDTGVDTEPEVTETPEVEVPEVEVETPNEKPDDVEVDTSNAEVNTANKPNGNVKIRMRCDHKCCIAMERYDLKAGKVYVVPANVKNILNKAGYLAPL